MCIQTIFLYVSPHHICYPRSLSFINRYIIFLARRKHMHRSIVSQYHCYSKCFHSHCYVTIVSLFQHSNITWRHALVINSAEKRVEHQQHSSYHCDTSRATDTIARYLAPSYKQTHMSLSLPLVESSRSFTRMQATLSRMFCRENPRKLTSLVQFTSNFPISM